MSNITETEEKKINDSEELASSSAENKDALSIETEKDSEKHNEGALKKAPLSARYEARKERKKYDVLYFLQLALKSMRNNIGMATASLAVLASCLVVMGSFFLLLINVDKNLDRVGELNKIVVYCDYELGEDEVAAIAGKINAIEKVTSCEAVSKDSAFEEMISDYFAYSGIFQTMKDENYNPLSDSFIIGYDDNENVGDLVYELSSIEGVRRVNNRAEVSVKVENLRRGIIFVFGGFFALLLVTSIFVIINTIKLALHFRRYDITVMKFVGATNVFVLTPFILEGAMIGMAAAIIATVVQTALYSHIINVTSEAFNSLIYLFPVSDCVLPIGLAFVLVGILCGLFGSVVSIRKNLKS